jgi:ABC-type transport system involved in multi-copper enzyme maturation permease subunit
MRAEARRPFTYWLRVVAAGLLLLVTVAVMLGGIGSGTIVFGALHSLLFASIWLVVPLLTADCISRERREGTLGLLFLTPLRARGIILAKGFVHGLRGGGYLLTALPTVTIPFLLGGVSAADLGRAALLDTSAVLLALAAGLLASTFCVRWSRALLAAALLSFGIGTALAAWHCWLLQNAVDRLEVQWSLLTGWGGIWAGATPGALIAATQVFLAAVAIFASVIFLAGYRLQHSWQESPPSPQQARLIRIFCTPLFWQQQFRHEQSRKLNRNPIAWLQQYSWSARLCTWGWCLGMLLYECSLASSLSWRAAVAWQPAAVAFIIGAIAFSASASFTRERQNGAMELLLVSPLTVAQIIVGRLRGVINQFIPAAGVWLLCVLFGSGLETVLRGAWLGFCFASCGLSCALVGFYFSMRRINFIAAWGLTLAFAIFFPLFLILGLLFLYAIFISADFRSAPLEPQNLFTSTLIILQGLIAWIAIARLRHDLKRRNFSFT